MPSIVETLRGRFLFDRGVRFAEQESYSEAMPLFEAVLERDPDDAVTLSNVGFCQFKMGRKDAAVESYRRAKALDSSDPQIPYELGCVFYDQGMKQEAHDAFREALDRMPSHHDAYSAMEKLRLELNLPLAEPNPASPSQVAVSPGRIVIEPAKSRVKEEPAPQIEKKVSTPPQPQKPVAAQPAAAPASPSYTVDELIDLGHNLFEHEQVDQALQVWGEACRRQPTNPVAHNNRAGALLTLKRYQEAIEASSEALRIDPTYAIAHMTRGEVYAALGNREAVLREYTALAQLDEDLARQLLELIEPTERS